MRPLGTGGSKETAMVAWARRSLALLIACVLVAGCEGRRATPTPTAPASPTPSPVIVAGVLPLPTPGAGVLPARTRAALQQVLDGYVASGAALDDPRGLTAAVVTADGVWSGAAGVDGDRRKLAPDSMMCIGSVTKTFIAAEVVHLAAAGRLGLDRPASDYLNHPLLSEKPTVRQLLSMTSGLPEIFNGALVGKLIAEPGRAWTADEVLTYADLTPASPGGGFVYTSTNFVLLGQIIGAVAGVGWEQAVRRDLLAGDHGRIVVQVAETPPGPLAGPDHSTGVRPDGRYVPDRALASGFGAAGGMAGDASALAHWGYDLYGGRVLPPAQVQQLSAPVTPGYGLGTGIDTTRPGDPVLGHGGAVDGYMVSMAVRPARRAAVAVLNPGTLDPAAFADRLLDIVAP